MNNPSLDSLLLTLLATQTPTSVEAHNGDTTITFPPPIGTAGPVLTVAKRWRIKAEPLGRPVATNSIQVAINGFNRSTDNYEVVERMKRLEAAGNAMAAYDPETVFADDWNKAKGQP
jgi:hypothetical protein